MTTSIRDTLQHSLGTTYRLERELGRGGMATVYLAEDVRHRRRVALKVLHPELSAVLGPDRFLKEIELTASLQHPHILPLFDSGNVGGQLYYVMPYVEGETLRARLERERQLSVGDAVRIATEVADALQYAHERGVIHRDIKPENILLQGGHALVADFGIALAVEQAGGQRMTQTGLSLGTPQYMAPEQATGEKGVDARADVYALGAVTYEMLAGEPPFTGPTAQAVVSRALTEDPRPLLPQRRSVPPHVEAAVMTALEKLPADRFAHATDFAAALAGHPGATSPAARGAAPRRLAIPVVIAVATLGAVALAFAMGQRTGRRSGAHVALGRTTPVTWDPGLEVYPAISPDGRTVAYAAGTSARMRIFVRPVAGGRAIALTNDSADVQSHPRWSPDGARVLFLARGGVFSAPSSGGLLRQEVPAGRGSPVASAAWSPDGAAMAYVVDDTLFVRAEGRAPRPVARFAEPTFCAWSPRATFIACSSGNMRYSRADVEFGNLSPSRIVVCRVEDGALSTVTDSLSLNQSPAWSPDGRHLYFVSNRDGPRDVYAVPIDGRRGSATGPPERLTTGLGAHSFSVSADGTRLAYAAFTTTANIWALPIPTRPPVSAAAVPVTRGSQVIETLRVSRDGRWLLYESTLAGSVDLYRMRIPDGEPERLTTDPGDEFGPDLSPDGREVAFHAWRSGTRDVYVMPLDGSAAQRVTASPEQEILPVWSPDGRALAFFEMIGARESATARAALWVARREPGGAWSSPTRRAPHAMWPTWSPDGRWIAYTGGTVSRYIAILPVDSGAPRVVLDSTQAPGLLVEQVLWSADGRTLYFKAHAPDGAASLWSVPAAGGTPTLLVRFDDPAHPSYRPQFAVGNGRFYFSVEDRQSDVGVIEVARR